MAGKWADHLVSGVRYDSAENCLDAVRVHSDNGATIGDDCEMPRSRVVSLLESGMTFCTVTRNTETMNLERGPEIEVATVDGRKYIRTDLDMLKKDHLGDIAIL
jgi:hypothetical protein